MSTYTGWPAASAREGITCSTVEAVMVGGALDAGYHGFTGQHVVAVSLNDHVHQTHKAAARSQAQRCLPHLTHT